LAVVVLVRQAIGLVGAQTVATVCFPVLLHRVVAGALPGVELRQWRMALTVVPVVGLYPQITVTELPIRVLTVVTVGLMFDLVQVVALVRLVLITLVTLVLTVALGLVPQ
jgi:hypothetical protein